MTMANLPQITRCGLPGVDHVPFGMHVCHFYRDRDELVAALVPYMAAGLSGNERCLWITAPPLPAREAVQALRAAWHGVDGAIRAGALRILDFDQWYVNAKGLKGLDIVQLWLEEEERALDAGYNGLRIAGNTSFLTPGDWSTFMEYEQAVTAGFSGRRIVALCSYALAHCNDRQMSEVLHAHHCALERPDADWQMVSGGDLIASGSASVAAHPGNGSPAIALGSSPAPVSDGSSTRAEPIRKASSAPPLSLAEAHHRIANNLEVISSLVRLQASDLARKKRSLTAQEVRQILDEVAGRITTVALLHRLLSHRPEQEVIDLGSYLHSVCDSLVAALAFGGQVEMSKLQDGLCHVRADHAAPLAVVVSELVTNAIKYGHPNGVPGRIAVSCHRASDGSLVLEISDDGVGLPAGFDPAVDGGLGFRVVRALAQQLGATLAFESNELGLTVRVGIPGLLQ